jgi:UDP-sugar transporter A1/2/3
MCLSNATLHRYTVEGSFARNFQGWTMRTGALSVLPSLIYATQNYLLVLGYASMDSVTFNCLNQSKLVSTALFIWLLFGVKQSYLQVVALAGLLGAGIMLQDSGGGGGGGGSGSQESGDGGGDGTDFRVGVMAVLVASALSGLASAACQVALQGMNRSSNALTLEMAAAAIPFLLVANGSVNPIVLFHGGAGYKLNPVDPSPLSLLSLSALSLCSLFLLSLFLSLESAWFQPLNL